ncbi:MAG: hypothetical protein KUG61_08400 [Parvibaculaceae bacterium]|nr:hypothetical protein [Parvibaculaceae bacterium]
MWPGGNGLHGGKPIKIGSGMEFDVTQSWVPAAVLSVLCTWIVLAALLEMRKPLEVAVESDGSEGNETPENSPAAAETVEPVPAAPAAKKKRSFLFRTSWFWGSLLIGALAQLYLNHIA